MLTNKVSWATRTLPVFSDQDPGGAGMSTGNKTMAGAVSADSKDVAGIDVLPQAEGTPAGHPVNWWIALIVLIVALKFAAENGNDGSSFSNIKVGFWNVMVITLSAIVGLIFTKWVFGMYRIPGLSDIVLAA